MLLAQDAHAASQRVKLYSFNRAAAASHARSAEPGGLPSQLRVRLRPRAAVLCAAAACLDDLDQLARSVMVYGSSCCSMVTSFGFAFCFTGSERILSTSATLVTRPQQRCSSLNPGWSTALMNQCGPPPPCTQQQQCKTSAAVGATQPVRAISN